jgi:hypothetical protein
MIWLVGSLHFAEKPARAQFFSSIARANQTVQQSSILQPSELFSCPLIDKAPNVGVDK